jgi:hypothetical protein
LVAGAAAACSVGGGGGSGPITNVGPVVSGSTNPQSSGKSKMALSLHIPAATANVASLARASAATRFGSVRHPNLVSTASNGLAIQGMDPNTSAASGPEYDFDISSTSQYCTSDNAGGRNCSFTITENAGSYYFVISTYASTPTAQQGGFAGLPSLDSATTTTYQFVGGTVSSIKLNLPQSLNAYVYPQTVNVGVVAFDAAGELIISSAPYSTPIFLTATTTDQNVTAALSITSTGSGQTTTSTTTSSYQSDVITLTYALAQNSPTVGLTINLQATAGSATTSATLSPLFISDSNNVLSATSINNKSVDVITEPNPNTPDTITLTEGSSFAGIFTITEDPLDTCQNNNPFTYTYNSNTTPTPPATVTASNGAVSFTLNNAGGTTGGNGCVYDIADGSGTIVPLSIQTSFTGTGNGNYNTNVPAGLLYLSAFSVATSSGPVNSVVAQPNQSAVGTVGHASILLVAPTATPNGNATSAPAALYQIADTNLVEPLGVTHDNAGDVFVADFGTGTVDEYVPGDIQTYPANPTTAYAYYNYPSPQPGASAEPDAPVGLAYNNKTGLLFIADYNAGQIYAIGEAYPPGSNPQAHHGSASRMPGRPVVSSSRKMPFANAARPDAVHRLVTGGPTPATVSAIFTVGGNPAGIAFDSSDNLYVSFPSTGLVQKYASVDGNTGGATYAISPTATIGGPNAGLTMPTEVTIGTDGTIFVQDAGSNLVYAFNPQNLSGGAATTAVQSSDYGFALSPSTTSTDTVIGTGFDANAGDFELFPGGTAGTPYAAYGTPASFQNPFPRTANQYVPFATF